MAEVKRYTASVMHPGVREDPEGLLVAYRHYADLKDKLEKLTKAGDAMASSIQFNEEMAKDYNGKTIVHQSVKRWNAAKDGKQSND
jgi:hypothetical protein